MRKSFFSVIEGSGYSRHMAFLKTKLVDDRFGLEGAESSSCGHLRYVTACVKGDLVRNYVNSGSHARESATVWMN